MVRFLSELALRYNCLAVATAYIRARHCFCGSIRLYREESNQQ